MPTRRYYANAAPQQTLAASITSGATSCQVAGSFTGWPTQFPFYAALDIGTAAFELVSVTGVVGTTATIVRAQDGTVAVSHPAGATLDQPFVRQDLDEANAHTSANAGVHGVAGSVVGTSDVQTLTNKTLTAPAITNPTSTGDATHPALTGKATTAGGKTLSLQNSSAVEKVGVDDAGNITAAGNVAATGNVTTSAGGFVATAGGVTASAGTVAGKVVSGALVPTTFTNEAAATAALPSPATDTIVWLTAPTTAGATAGLFSWSGTAWTQVVPTSTFGHTVVSNSTLNASGQQTITHGLAVTPSVILLTTERASQFPIHFQLFSKSSTSFVIQAIRLDTGAPFLGDTTATACNWECRP